MKKKYLTIIIILSIIIILLVGGLIYFLLNNKSNETIELDETEGKDNITQQEPQNKYPTEGNDYVITTNSDTTIRIVNEYDKSFFTKDKNLLIMFASWCPNCKEEISEVEKIIKHYKNSKDVNVVIIAHEYDDTIEDLISLLENDVDFGNIEVKVDLNRIIRKTIDPEASTIPISYVVNKKGKVLTSFNESITLAKAIEMVK